MPCCVECGTAPSGPSSRAPVVPLGKRWCLVTDQPRMDAMAQNLAMYRSPPDRSRRREENAHLGRVPPPTP